MSAHAGEPAYRFRVASGSSVDPGRKVRFTFDGKDYEGLVGDTLASALLANGVRVVGRSLKYHRARGILSAGFEEPNALVQVGEGDLSEANALATRVELYDGLVAESVNRWPSLTADLFAATGLLSRFLPAGFYYKTFFAHPTLWHRVFEPMLRGLAGFGVAPREPDPESYDRRHLHCDVLVVGGGPAGIAAARAAVEAGIRVALVEDSPWTGHAHGDPSAQSWLDASVESIAGQVTVLNRTTAFGAYDGNFVAAVERVADHMSPGERAGVRQRLWMIRAKRIVLATGAIERPLVFPGNDRPGVMLAGAAKLYLERHGVLAGRRLAVFTNNDSAYDAAFALNAAGCDIAAIIDVRQAQTSPQIAVAREKGIPVFAGTAVGYTIGRRGIRAVRVAPLDGGAAQRIACDGLLMSGGWSPTVHLFAQRGGRTTYDEARAAYLPVPTETTPQCAGALAGDDTVAAAIRSGLRAGARAAAELGMTSPVVDPGLDEATRGPVAAFWKVPVAPRKARKSFVDFQNDTTLADLSLAMREGFTHPEHVKRYTLTGFGTDQGKTGNINALGIVSAETGVDLAMLAPTTFRPPFLPVTFGALAGRDKDALLDPVRTTALHDWHVSAGAAFENVGQWKRPWYYPRPGESMDAAVRRECLAVRNAVGMLDASTLGKIEVVGPDATEFLNRIYTNAWSKLAVGRCRYGLMCREDGMLFDDGTTTRFAENHFLMTTTTGNAVAVLEWLEEWLQTEWPELRVYCTSVTDHWATVVLTGPKARDVLSRVAPELDLDNAAFPFMSLRQGSVAGVDARIFRISFTGELSYEINVPWHAAMHVWEAVHAAGAPHGITPYGTEAMHVLRAEKGYPIIGQDTDGTVTPIDLGMSWAVSKKKDFLGKRSLSREDTARSDRKQLVGLLPVDGKTVLAEGAQIVGEPHVADIRLPQERPVPMEGHVTSSYDSAALGRPIALALVRNGFARMGETVYAVTDGRPVAARVTSTVFYDPDGARRDG